SVEPIHHRVYEIGYGVQDIAPEQAALLFFFLLRVILRLFLCGAVFIFHWLQPPSYGGVPPASLRPCASFRPQQFLYFLPLPQGQGSLRPTFWEADTLRGCRGWSPARCASTGLACSTRSGV